MLALTFWEVFLSAGFSWSRVSAGALHRQQPGSGAWPWCPAPDQPGDSATAFTQHEDKSATPNHHGI